MFEAAPLHSGTAHSILFYLSPFLYPFASTSYFIPIPNLVLFTLTLLLTPLPTTQQSNPSQIHRRRPVHQHDPHVSALALVLLRRGPRTSTRQHAASGVLRRALFGAQQLPRADAVRVRPAYRQDRAYGECGQCGGPRSHEGVDREVAGRKEEGWRRGGC